MRALVYDSYGSIEKLRVADVPDPPLRSGELLIEVRAAALNPKDALVRKGKFRWVSGGRFPKFVGLDYAGVVLESRTATHQVGQRVFGMLEELTSRRGTLAELVRVRPHEAAPISDAVSFSDAASVALAGLTALQALRDIARVEHGHHVWIHGASGGVGSLAIQLARILGARVTTTTSDKNLELVASLGADEPLDYRAEHLESLRGRVDVVFDVFGNLEPRAIASVWRGGRGTYVNTIPSAQRLARDVLTRRSAVRERLVVVRSRRSDLDELARMLAEGTLRAVIEQRFTMSTAHEAFRLLESKRSRGKLAFDIGG